LRVVVSPDRAAPVATVGVYYNIGFRIEPRGRSGFAHLFEHMMFQGSANAGKMVHIKLINSSGGVLNGKAVHLVTPPYPAIARSAHASGAVQVQVLIDENGNVISANAVSGHPLLRAAAVAAAHASKFTPTKLSGQPVKVNGVIIYNFVAQ